MDAPQSGTSSGTPKKTKRETVIAACERCRRHKIKCNAKRPCTECSRLKTPCRYSVKVNETHGQAVKRKYMELEKSRDNLYTIYEFLSKKGQNESAEILRRMKSGEDIEAIARAIQSGNIRQSITSSHECLLRQRFLVSLAQSNASASEIIELASSVFSTSSRISIPSLQSLENLKTRIITLETIAGVLSDTNRPRIGPRSSKPRSFDHSTVSDGSYDGPRFWVPADGWTNITKDDEAVSQLVSIFFTFSNPFWRLVEEDVFLHAMRSRILTSPYCSQLLVNAILAHASLHSQIDVAFTVPGQHTTRGENFHNEALRLWELEEGRPSITNIQSLCVLACESSCRGKDKLGMSLLRKACVMNAALPVPDIVSDLASTAAIYGRVRSCIASSVVWQDLSFTIGLLRPFEALSSSIDDVPDLAEILPDRIVNWIGHPQSSEPLPLSFTRLTLARSDMTHFIWNTMRLLFSKAKSLSYRDLYTTSYSLVSQMAAWYQGLPAILRYKPKMPAPLYELHAQHYITIMYTYGQSLERLQTCDIEDDNMRNEAESWKETLRTQVLRASLDAATIIKDFREAHGLQIIPEFIFQAATVATHTLLPNLQMSPVTNDNRVDSELRKYTIVIDDTEAAFIEGFRLLLTNGLQMFLARGVVRMIVHMAKSLEIQLPETVHQTLSIMADVAWKPEDLHQLFSSYPMRVIVANHNTKPVHYEMEDMLRKWEEFDLHD